MRPPALLPLALLTGALLAGAVAAPAWTAHASVPTAAPAVPWPVPIPATLPHPPIHIVGDAGFRDPLSGVVGGSGTAEDPYVIGGWSIGAPGVADAIRLEGTSAHVVLRGNWLHDGDHGLPERYCTWGFSIQCHGITLLPAARTGIALVDAQNVLVEGNLLERNGIGVRAERSDVVLRGVSVHGQGIPQADAPGALPAPPVDGCLDVVETAVDTVLARPTSPVTMDSAPPAGLVALDSRVRVEGGTFACVHVGLFARGGSLEVRDLRMPGLQGIGGFLEDVAPATLRGLAVQGGRSGLLLWQGTQAQVAGSTFEDLLVQGVFACGGQTTVRVEGNTFRGLGADDAGSDAIHVGEGVGCHGWLHADIVGNTLEDVGIGIHFVQAFGSIVGNALRAGRDAGVYTQFGDPLLRDNVIEGFPKGLILRGHNGQVEGNTLRANDIGVLVVGDPASLGPKPVLRHNALLGNERWDVANSEDNLPSSEPTPGTFTLDARENWWGSADGPAPGRVLGAADVAPWRTAPP